MEKTLCVGRPYLLLARTALACRYAITPWLEATFTVLPPVPQALMDKAARNAALSNGEAGATLLSWCTCLPVWQGVSASTLLTCC